MINFSAHNTRLPLLYRAPHQHTQNQQTRYKHFSHTEWWGCPSYFQTSQPKLVWRGWDFCFENEGEEWIVLPVTKEHLPDEHIPEDIIEENGKVGALFASKALVQLLINPCVGSITNNYGYSSPFIFGTATLFISSMSRFWVLVSVCKYLCAVFSCGRSYLVLLLARMLHGVASSFISVAGMGTIALLFTQDDQRSQ